MVCNDRLPEFGDVIYVERFAYRHFGVYTDFNMVVHYVKEQGGGIIRETSLREFLDGSNSINICRFEREKLKKTLKDTITSAIITTISLGWGIAYTLYKSITSKSFKIYSPEETVARARSQIGMRGYNLLTHNCEHFAIWCKTGISDSKQVDALLESMVGGGLISRIALASLLRFPL